MIKPSIKRIKSSLIFAGLALGLAFSAQAEKADLNKEINISGARTAGDLKNKIFSYIDDVVITQGTLIINADLVQIHTDIKSKEKTYIAKGSPATFKQTLDDGTPIYLQANEIKYEPSQNTVIIAGNAELRQEGSKVNSNTITYNFETEQVHADSDENNRVKTVLQPKVLDKKDK